MRAAVLMPALNEEEALPLVLADLRCVFSGRVVVIDNGSTDGTAAAARAAGAEVIREEKRGYGSACLAGLRALGADPPEVVVFLDADRSDDASELPKLLAPIARGEADLVMGERRSLAERGALTPAQRVGNRVAIAAMYALLGHKYRDLGPFRAIRWSSLSALGMADPAFGWNVEMQMKAARAGLRIVEIPVRYRPRGGGESKISGTVRGTLRAGLGMLGATWRHR